MLEKIWVSHDRGGISFWWGKPHFDKTHKWFREATGVYLFRINPEALRHLSRMRVRLNSCHRIDNPFLPKTRRIGKH